MSRQWVKQCHKHIKTISKITIFVGCFFNIPKWVICVHGSPQLARDCSFFFAVTIPTFLSSTFVGFVMRGVLLRVQLYHSQLGACPLGADGSTSCLLFFFMRESSLDRSKKMTPQQGIRWTPEKYTMKLGGTPQIVIISHNELFKGHPPQLNSLQV